MAGRTAGPRLALSRRHEPEYKPAEIKTLCICSQLYDARIPTVLHLPPRAFGCLILTLRLPVKIHPTGRRMAGNCGSSAASAIIGISTTRKMSNGRLSRVCSKTTPALRFCAPNWNAASPTAALAPNGTCSTTARCRKAKRWNSCSAPTRSQSAKTAIHCRFLARLLVPRAKSLRYSITRDPVLRAVGQFAKRSGCGVKGSFAFARPLVWTTAEV